MTLVIGHRGNSSVAPQNTLAAFEAAARAGADLVELDLQLTADGQIVVIHDDTVDATTSGSGPVSDYTFDDLRALDAGSWFAPSFAGQRVPLFAEVLTLLHHHPQVGLLAEFKDVWTPEDAAQATAAIIGTGLAERTIVQSFYPQTVAALRDVAPSLRRGLLIEEPHDGLLDACADLGVITCNPSVEMTEDDPSLIPLLHGAGLSVMVWTADDVSQWRALVAAGAEGIITNRPDRLLGWLS